MEFWFVLSILVAFLWGSAGVFAKVSTPKLGVARIALIIAVVEGVMYTFAYLLWREDVAISLEDGVLAAASCIIGITGYLCFFESIMDGPVAIAGTISAAYPALTVVGAVLLLSETLTGIQAAGVAAIICGVVALSYDPGPLSKRTMSKRALIFSFLAFGLWGVWSLTSKMAIDEIGAGNIFAFYILSSLTAPLIYGWFRRVRPGSKGRSSPVVSAWVLGALALGLNVTGAFAYSFALEEGSASLVVPISSAYPIVTIVMALVFLRERFSVLNAVALAVVVLGLVAIGITL